MPTLLFGTILSAALLLLMPWPAQAQGHAQGIRSSRGTVVGQHPRGDRDHDWDDDRDDDRDDDDDRWRHDRRDRDDRLRDRDRRRHAEVHNRLERRHEEWHRKHQRDRRDRDWWKEHAELHARIEREHDKAHRKLGWRDDRWSDVIFRSPDRDRYGSPHRDDDWLRDILSRLPASRND